MDDECLCDHLADAVLGGGRVGSRRGRGLRHVRRQRVEVVRRPSRSGCGADGGRFRRRCRGHRCADHHCDQDLRLRQGVPVVRARAGTRDSRAIAIPEGAEAGRGTQGGETRQPGAARIPADGDARHAPVLDSVRDVRDGRGERPRGHGAGRADRARLQNREPAGEFPVHRIDGAGDGGHHRQHPQRAGAADVRVGVGPHRAREHDGHRLHMWCRRLLGARHDRQHAVDVHRHRGDGLLHVGRDLQPVSGDLHRHLRRAVRDDQCGAALHRQGHGVVPRAGRELAAESDRQLALRLRRGSRREHSRRRHRAARGQADARVRPACGACGRRPGDGEVAGCINHENTKLPKTHEEDHEKHETTKLTKINTEEQRSGETNSSVRRVRRTACLQAVEPG